MFLSAKEGAPGDNGAGAVALVKREVQYGPAIPPPNGCVYPHGGNGNIRPPQSTMWMATTGPVIFAPQSGWATHTTATYSTDHINQDLQIRIYENVGGTSVLRVDNVRIRCNNPQSEGDCQ